MILYRFLIILFMILGIIALVVAIVFHVFWNKDFIASIFVGIFTGALVSFLSSVFTYFHEKNRALDDYYLYLEYILNAINCYQDDWSLKDKVDYYIRSLDFDFYKNETLFGRISLFNKEDQNYIYEKLYKPICDIRVVFKRTAYHCNIFNSKTYNVADETIEGIIKKTEDHFMHYKALIIPELNDEIIQTVRNRFVESMLAELNGRYYYIMYPWKKGQNKFERQENDG